MKRLVKPYAIALYLLSFIVFLFAGMLYAAMTGAAEGQGLAGGAIVFMNGIFFSLVAVIVSVFAVIFAEPKVVRFINIGLLVILVGLLFYLGHKYTRISKGKSEPVHTPEKMTTSPISTISIAMEDFGSTQEEEELGLGFFKPDFFSYPVLYFYASPNFEKTVSEHFPIDSIVFERQEYGGFEIVYAPPWLQPHHLKLDYDILYFRILTLGHEMIEVCVNTLNQNTVYVDRFKGDVLFWPDFLLGVAAIEFPEGSEQALKFKPFDHASEVVVMDHHSFMKPVFVRGDWIKVQLQDQHLNNISSGWIRWQRDGKLLVNYALLS